jgi:hypothetical protein
MAVFAAATLLSTAAGAGQEFAGGATDSTAGVGRMGEAQRDAALRSFSRSLPFLAASRAAQSGAARRRWALVSALPAVLDWRTGDQGIGSLAFGWSAAYMATSLMDGGAGALGVGAGFVGNRPGMYLWVTW